MIEYSETELRLIKACSKSWCEIALTTNMSPPILYDVLAADALVENKQGPHIEALKRAIMAIRNCSPCRMTPEFDKLCEFSEKNS